MSERLLETDPTRVLDRVVGVINRAAISEADSVTVAAPQTDTEVSNLLRVASEEGWKVLPQGASIGPPKCRASPRGEGLRFSPAPDLVISLLGMTEVVDYQPADQNVTVRAGVTLGAIQSLSSREEQWLALDPPGGNEVTLGGVVSTGLSGPLRSQYGRPRDHVLGLTLVDGGGRVLSLGGRVVKNVAGFDLVRLATGSRGAFGVINEITFRLHPRAEEDRTLVWHQGDLGAAWDVGRSLMVPGVPVAAAELLLGPWQSPLEGSGARIVLRLTGSGAAVQRTVDFLSEVAGAPDETLVAEASEAVWLAISEGLGDRRVTFRLHTLPSRGRDLAPALAETPFERLALHVSTGTFRGTMADGEDLESLRGLADSVWALGGTFGVTGAESSLGLASEPEPSPAKARLLRELIRAFDGSGVLPGAWRERWGAAVSPLA